MDTFEHQTPILHRLSPNSRPTIGIISPGLVNNHLWVGINTIAQQYAVNVIGWATGLLASPYGFEAQANILLNIINPNLVDGLIVDSDLLCHYANVPALQTLCDHYALPIVSNCIPLKGIPSVLLDFRQGIHDMLTHLIDIHGYRRIAFIRGPVTSWTGEERFRAYQEGLAQHGIAFAPELVTPGTFLDPSGAEAVRLLFDERHVKIDAIMAANDFMAVGALAALHTRGIRVPEDIAVVGFDDNQDAIQASILPLTTVNFQISVRICRLMELLLASLEGKPVPEQVMVSPKLIVRHSCGCASTEIINAATAPIVSRADSAALRLSDHRDALLSELRQTCGMEESDLPYAAMLLNSFIDDLMGERPGKFLLTVKTLGLQDNLAEADLGRWQNILSALRRCLQPWIGSADALARAEDLWQQGRILFSEIGERAQLAKKIRSEQQLQSIQTISQTLLATFDMAELLDILARELPKIGIRSCSLALYEDPSNPTGQARLLLAYNEQGRLFCPQHECRFPVAQLVPPALFTDDQRIVFIVEALYFQQQQLGFVVFDLDADSQFVCHTGSWFENPLRGLLSNAIQGALLVQQVQEHAAQIVRQKNILEAFMANVPDAIYLKDTHGRFIRANQSLAGSLGAATPDELIGKTDFDFFPESQAQRKYEQEQGILHTGEPLLAFEEPHMQGGWRLTTKMPLRDEHDRIVGTFGISHDITSLKQTEAELRRARLHLEELVDKRTRELTQSNALLHDEILERRRIEEALRTGEQQYRLLAENVKDGLLIEQDGKLVFANKVFTLMSGHSLDALVQCDLDTLFPRLAEMPQPLSNWLEHTRQGNQEMCCQAELRASNGETIWTEIEPIEMTWNGHAAHLLTIRDITHRKLQEDRLQAERARLQQENSTLRSTIKERYRFGKLIGKSLPMQQVYKRIINAAASDVNVLIAGESGTGKELIARTLHQVSARKAHAFVPVNCASIPETLFEREFFGHQRGAFTGADRDKAGFFDRAHQGVLFLDEVTELSPGNQAKLLRVLQDGEYIPLGSNRIKQADVLIVAATNTDYHEEIARGRLRKDFFYRICVVAIETPPLRTRKDDLPLLVEHLLELYYRKRTHLYGTRHSNFPNDQIMLPGELIQAFYHYHWPGNVRELQNILQRYLATRDLNAILASLGGANRPGNVMRAPEPQTISEAVLALEKQMIAEALEATQYNIARTAKRLGLARSSLYRKIDVYHLHIPEKS